MPKKRYKSSQSKQNGLKGVCLALTRASCYIIVIALKLHPYTCTFTVRR